MVSRTQASRPRPRKQKNPRPWPRTNFSRTGPLEANDRNARGNGPRTQAQRFSRKKRSPKIFFGRSPKVKKRSPQSFLEVSGIFQRNFNDLKNSTLLGDDREIFKNLRLRGQGLDFRGQRKELQNVSSRPKTSLRTSPLVIISN